jgi:hypothetical protein
MGDTVRETVIYNGGHRGRDTAGDGAGRDALERHPRESQLRRRRRNSIASAAVARYGRGTEVGRQGERRWATLLEAGGGALGLLELREKSIGLFESAIVLQLPDLLLELLAIVLQQRLGCRTSEWVSE